MCVSMKKAISYIIILSLSLTAINIDAYTDTPQQIVCTPHGDLKTQVGLAWITAQNGSDAIAQVVKKPDGLPDWSSSVQYTGETGNNGRLRWHKVVVTGLNPGTTYQYRVGDDGCWSGINEFTTAPDKAEPFTFLQLNDSQIFHDGTAAEEWGSSLSRAAAIFPDFRFIAHGGDHVDVSTEDTWRMFFGVAPEQPSVKSIFGKTIFSGTRGNHDPAYTIHYFNYDSPFADQWYYSFDYADMHVTVIDMENWQMNWIKYDIVKNAKKWNIVLQHFPIVSARSNVLVYPELSSVLFDLLNIDAVFAGHEHIYARTYPVRNNTAITSSPLITNQTVAGIKNVTLFDNPKGTLNYINNNTGSKYYTAAHGSFFAQHVQPHRPTFAGVTVTENELVNSAYYIDGNNDVLIEHSGILKTAPRINPPQNVKRTYADDTMTITWDAPCQHGGNPLGQYVVYDENNHFTTAYYTVFTTENTVTVPMDEDTYNSTDFVVKAIGNHSISDVGTDTFCDMIVKTKKLYKVQTGENIEVAHLTQGMFYAGVELYSSCSVPKTAQVIVAGYDGDKLRHISTHSATVPFGTTIVSTANKPLNLSAVDISDYVVKIMVLNDFDTIEPMDEMLVVLSE